MRLATSTGQNGRRCIAFSADSAGSVLIAGGGVFFVIVYIEEFHLIVNKRVLTARPVWKKYLKVVIIMYEDERRTVAGRQVSAC